ncbi:phage antirepressor KilAC domain-containing protein [Paenibacillus sp. FSL R10-2779]|uniref:phage antirepressor n=1 Tax=Paenibacillus sp. FSL R10-2779 TaxID=2975340 RepID=UPI0030FBD35E
MEQLENVINIEGVRAYLDETGNAFLNLEDVARGLGFTQMKGVVEYIRWETVSAYLRSFGFSQQAGKDDFIPESVFYRLAMKAKNEVAEAFQAKIAEEILPAIRKHDGYLTSAKIEEALLNPDVLIQLATDLKRERAERERLQVETERQAEVIEEQTERLTYSDDILRSVNTMAVTQIAADYDLSAVALNVILKEAGIQRKVGKQWVLYRKYHGLGLTKSHTQSVDTDYGPKVVVSTEWTQAGRLLIHRVLLQRGVHAIVDRGSNLSVRQGGSTASNVVHMPVRKPQTIVLSLRVDAK